MEVSADADVSCVRPGPRVLSRRTTSRTVPAPFVATDRTALPLDLLASGGTEYRWRHPYPVVGRGCAIKRLKRDAP